MIESKSIIPQEAGHVLEWPAYRNYSGKIFYGKDDGKDPFQSAE